MKLKLKLMIEGKWMSIFLKKKKIVEEMNRIDDGWFCFLGCLGFFREDRCWAFAPSLQFDFELHPCHPYLRLILSLSKFFFLLLSLPSYFPPNILLPFLMTVLTTFFFSLYLSIVVFYRLMPQNLIFSYETSTYIFLG